MLFVNEVWNSVELFMSIGFWWPWPVLRVKGEFGKKESWFSILNASWLKVRSTGFEIQFQGTKNQPINPLRNENVVVTELCSEKKKMWKRHDLPSMIICDWGRSFYYSILQLDWVMKSFRWHPHVCMCDNRSHMHIKELCSPSQRSVDLGNAKISQHPLTYQMNLCGFKWCCKLVHGCMVYT